MTTLLAVAAWLLGLSVLVQVIQEIWKYVTSSKARSFEKALADLLGPTIAHDLRQDPLITVRGPLQFRRVGRAGWVLPTDKEELLFAMERSAPAWHVTVLRALQAQVSLASAMPARPTWQLENALKELAGAAVSPGAPGNPAEVHAFLQRIGVMGEGEIDAPRALEEFKARFFDHLQPLRDHYPQFIRNFEFAYQRRNLRQSFVIALLLAVLLNFPFEVIYRRAASLSPAEAVAVASQAEALYARLQTATATPAEQQPEQLATLDQLRKDALTLVCRDRDALDGTVEPQAAVNCSNVDYLTDPSILTQLLRFRSNPVWTLRYVFGCLLTALLLTFGAPFWNDLLGLFGRAARPPKASNEKASS